MQKLTLTQSLQQKLSPQQIQFIKLLQVPTAELETRVEEELESNPALEEGKGEEESEYDSADDYEEYEGEEPNLEEYLQLVKHAGGQHSSGHLGRSTGN